MNRRLILDLSRMLSRARYPVPTGIDRVELAYAEGLLARAAERTHFGAVHPIGVFAHLSRRGTRRFLDLTARRWRGKHGFGASGDMADDAADDGAAGGEAAGNGAAEGGAASDEDVQRAARTLRNSILLRSQLPGSSRLRGGHGRRSAYLLISHHHLDRPAVIEGIMQRDRAAFVPMVHDLIPIGYPEFCRPGEPERHQRRIETVARLADAVVVNSEATRQSLLPWLDRAGRNPPVLVAPLGVDPAPPRPQGARVLPGKLPGALAGTRAGSGPERPYFVCVGTIEPRKNHLLLLQIWRRLAEQLGPAAPRLVLVGRRGWENEQVLDLLERCPPLVQGLVEEHNDLSDAASTALLLRAAALLVPSFVEGYGLPLAEALAAGVPAICSDLPPFREVGGDVPEYLDPLDGLGWMRSVLDYADPASRRRAAQLERLARWKAPSWEEHLESVLDLVDHGIA